ncbi:MAG: hypothetical protein ACQETL_07880 [Bacteroidota bacterium]
MPISSACLRLVETATASGGFSYEMLIFLPKVSFYSVPEALSNHHQQDAGDSTFQASNFCAFKL